MELVPVLLPEPRGPADLYNLLISHLEPLTQDPSPTGPCWLWATTRRFAGGPLYIYPRPGGRRCAWATAWHLFVGDLPEGFVVRPACAQRRCCHPLHLLARPADRKTERLSYLHLERLRFWLPRRPRTELDDFLWAYGLARSQRPALAQMRAALRGPQPTAGARPAPRSGLIIPPRPTPWR